MIYKVIIFLTLCIPTPEGTKCTAEDIEVNSVQVATKEICEATAEQANWIFLENDVRYTYPGDGSFFLPGAKCQSERSL